MKKIIALLLVLVMVLGLVACSAKETSNADEKKEETSAPAEEKKEETSAPASTEEELTGTITFAHHRVDLIEETEAVAEAFMKEHPGVTVEVEAVADYAKNMAIRLSAGEVPDVLFMDYSVAPLSTWSQYLQPIDDTRLKGKVQCEDFYTIDGHLYGLQSVGGYKGCFMYNKDLYAQAGITELPTTWAEFEACLEKLSKLDGIIPLTTQYKTGWAIEHWVYYFASAVLGYEWENTWAETDAPWSNETLLTVMNNFKGVVDKGYCDPELMSSDWDLQAADFAAGKIGTYLTGTFAYSTMTALGMDGSKIGFFALPVSELTDDGSTRLVENAEICLTVSKTTKNREAALAFAEFACENLGIMTGALSPIKGVPSDIAPINDLLASDTTLISELPDSDDVTEISKLAAYVRGAFVQEYIIADDPSTVVDAYNNAWKEARAEYYGQ